MKITSLTITIFCHETESKDKILSSLVSFFGNIINSFKIDEREVEGHYGNKIKIIELKSTGDLANEIGYKILESLDYADILMLFSTLNNRMEGNKLHLRLDKQNLIANNKILLKDGDDVIKVVITVKNKESLKEELKQIANRNLHT